AADVRRPDGDRDRAVGLDAAARRGGGARPAPRAKRDADGLALGERGRVQRMLLRRLEHLERRDPRPYPSARGRISIARDVAQAEVNRVHSKLDSELIE